MGIRLRYAKVVDQDLFLRTGGTVRPGLDNEIRLVEDGTPAQAAPFLVLRAWDDVDGAFTETWRLVDPHGRTVRPATTREILQGQSEINDEIVDQQFEYADDSYQLVLEIDDREVARANFSVLPRGPAI
jgi:hypothetical protein